MALDAFNRLRISNPFSLFDYYPSPLSANSSLDEDQFLTFNSGSNYSISYNSANYISLNLTGSGYIIRQSKVPMDYQPGKSRLIYISGVVLASSSGTGSLNSSIGLMNTSASTINEGIYFKTDGTTLYWAETVQTTSSTTAETAVAQSSWNIDTFNGSGPSGQTLTSSNLATNLIFVIDQEWLGVGRVRCGFVINGILYYAHQFIHSGNTVQYTTTPRQYITQYLTSTGKSASSRQMCCTCISEGGYLPLGKRNSISTKLSGGIAVTNGTQTTGYIALGLKLQSSYLNGMLKPINLSIATDAAAGKMGYYEIQLHTNSSAGSIGSISGTLPSYTALTDSIAQYVIGNATQTIATNGYILVSGFVTGRSDTTFSRNDFETLLTRAICTQYDTIYIVVYGNSGCNMFASVDFIESI